MVSRTACQGDVIFLWYWVFFWDGTLFGHFVVFYRSAKILLCTYTHALAFLQCDICIRIHFKRTSKTSVFFLDEDCQTIASSFSWKAFDVAVDQWNYIFSIRWRDHLDEKGILPLKQVFSKYSASGSSCNSSGCVLLVNLLRIHMPWFESKVADLHTKLNSSRHLSSQSLLLDAWISFTSGIGSFRRLRGWRSKTYRLLGHSLSGRLAVKK